MDTDPKDSAEHKLAPLQIIQDFTDKLTLRRLATVLVAGIMALGLYTGYEKRVAIFDQVLGTTAPYEQTDWEVTQKTREELTALANGPLIKLALVTHVDLPKNKRTVKFWYLNDKGVAAIALKVSTMLPQAVFDYDELNTQQMVAVLNNEFTCTPFKDTVYNRFFPELAEHMPVICRAAVPPFYGRFVGILTFGLSRVPTKSELDVLRIESSRIAVQIYLRDVIKR